MTEVADSLTWLKGRHTIKAGLDLRWERLNVIQPPSPTGSFTFNAVGSDLPGVANTGTPLASFLLGQVQLFSIDLQQSQIQERAHFQEYFIQDDWKVSDRLTLNPGLRYTLNFPSNEINGQTAVFNLQTQQLEYPGDNPVRPLKKNNFGPRMGGVYRLTDKTILSAGYGLVWIEMAGITTPFTTPTFPFLQTASQRALDTINPAFVLQNGPSVAPIGPTPTAGLGQGVFAVDATLGSGYVQQWNVAVQRELTTNTTFEAAYVGSFITHVGLPDTNLNQLSASQLAQGASLEHARAEPVLRHHPAVVVARRSDDSGLAADEAVSGVYHGQPLPQQRRHDAVRRARAQRPPAARARPAVHRRLHAFQAGRRRLVGVRRVDSDRADRELPGRRQLQPRARARLLDRRHAARVRLVDRLGSADGRGTARSSRTGCSARSSTTGP